MWKASPGLCRYVAETGPYLNALNGLVLRIFSGEEPKSAADSRAGSTVLCEFNPDSAGLEFEVGGGAGVLNKDSLQLWSALEAAAGEATFFRLEAAGDSGAQDNDAIRLQGTVGKVGADMLLSSTTFAAGSPRTIKHFTLVIPSM